ncbi:MAG: signal recognition particle protein [Candidatus Eisenbacteria bacterium]|uniref:Signal recognition particle protein n=1 Tax=Eiseniibacteriota bacterium TaxID=2212470 RepID=A0A937XDZ7_UNCEI|nr:signal recognition particle protein [Candidatus Eisenbacteria bacterium]
MFEALAGRLEQTFSRLRGRGKLTPENIRETLREVRRALLEADVHYAVARDFVRDVEQRAIGAEVLRSLTPGQQLIKAVHDALVELLGGQTAQLAHSHEIPTRLVLVGLQGSGKTTTAAKVAALVKKRGRIPLLAAGDVRRPAAIDQLQRLGVQTGVQVHAEPGEADAAAVASRGWDQARRAGVDYYIVDTAGRLQIDEEMMQELERVCAAVRPHQILLVVDGLTGQEAVAVSEAFHRRLALGGAILTKMEGDARGGAALSIRAATGVPILFVGTGEGLGAIEPFHPPGMASRILGMGDVLALAERAQGAVDLEEAEALRRRLERDEFNLEHFLRQMKEVRKMGPLEEVLKLIPGLGGKLAQVPIDGRDMARVEAIVLSMTPGERRRPEILNGSRRKRVARGSGTTVQEVNRLLRDFAEMRRMFGRMRKGGKLPGLLRGR